MNRVVQNLSKEFITPSGEPLEAIRDASFEVRDREFLCLLGPSGCGKSTTLNIIAGLETPSSGRVLIGNIPLAEALATAKIGYIFQQPRLLNWRTTEGNVLFPLEALSGVTEEQRNIARKCLELVDLKGFEKVYPLQLSGGMQQRVAIARALAIDPDVLLMDEPFSNLDEITSRKLRKELLRIWEQEKKTVLFVTHDVSEAVFLADRIVLMTRRPATVCKTISVKVPRPRNYENVELFNLEKEIMLDFYKLTGLE